MTGCVSRHNNSFSIDKPDRLFLGRVAGLVYRMLVDITTRFPSKVFATKQKGAKWEASECDAY